MGWFKFSFREIKTGERGKTFRQDRYSGEKGSPKHEHTWSKTTSSGGGQHKEGWVGSDSPRGGGKK